jgi:hypothetical protein
MNCVSVVKEQGVHIYSGALERRLYPYCPYYPYLGQTSGEGALAPLAPIPQYYPNDQSLRLMNGGEQSFSEEYGKRALVVEDTNATRNKILIAT